MISNGKPHLRHWGVLVSDMTMVDARAILFRKTEYGANDETELGTMYELFRDEDYNNVKITRPFEMATIREEWSMVDFQLVGETQLTHELIKQEGNFPKYTPLIAK
jgi:hypothetical protein